MKKVAILIDTTLSLGRDLLRGIVQYANTQGPWLFYNKHQAYKTKKQQHDLIVQLKKWQPDGIIIREKQIHEEFINMGIPLVVNSHVQKPIKNMANLVADDFGIGQIGGEYLLKKGFLNFAFCGYKNLLWSKERYKGYSDKLNNAGLKPGLYECSIRQMENSHDEELSKIGSWLKSLPKPLAVMTCSDQVSQHITEACKLFEIPVPNAVAVLGVHNDDIICETSYPSLSSVELDTKNAGYQCAKLLDKMMTGTNNENIKEVLIQPTHVVTRQSTNIMAINDEDVLLALQFIHENANRIIQVQDVVDHSNVSKRVLQRKFKTFIGNPIHKEITANRIEHISQAILKSDLTISEIALSLGYNDIGNFSRYFKKIKEISPQDYRRTFRLK